MKKADVIGIESVDDVIHPGRDRYVDATLGLACLGVPLWIA